MTRRLVRDLPYASIAYYLSEAFYMIRGLVLAGILGPASFGIWTSMRMVLTLGAYAHIGAHGGMLQRSAFLSGAGEEDRADAYRRVAAAVSLTGSFAVAAVLVAVVASTAAPTGVWMALAAVLVSRNVY